MSSTDSTTPAEFPENHAAIDVLRAAANRLDALDQAAPGGKWERVTDYVNTDVRKDVEVCTIVSDPDFPASPATWPLLDMMDGSLEEREAGADLICALRPLAAPLYAWLNRLAAEYTPGDEFVSRQVNDALAVALAVLGRSS